MISGKMKYGYFKKPKRLDMAAAHRYLKNHFDCIILVEQQW